MNKIKVGLPPESVVYTGDRKSEKYDLSVISYSKEALVESKELPNKNESDLSQWVSLQGLNSIDIIKKLGANYSINPLVQEDIVNTYHKPKIEVSDDYVFIILEYVLGSHPELKKSNISFYLGRNHLISFWDDEKVLFEKVKTRFKAKDSLVRTKSVDFLLSRLVDRVVDEYYVSLEYFNDLLGIELFFKCENFQKTGSFKIRGASNAIFSLTNEEAKQGVACQSSGNHGGAIACAAYLKGIHADIVMAKSVSKAKIHNVKTYKGNMIFCDTMGERDKLFANTVKDNNRISIHPYDNFDVMAGQGYSIGNIRASTRI